jgi:hypothetical protein
MGTMTFQLPAGLIAEAARELERACLAGGPDNMPWPTQSRNASGFLGLTRSMDESAYLVAPWSISGAGQLMGTSATLMERVRPYNLLVELARGKINQVRCQASDWRTGGLLVSAELEQRIQDASRAFGNAVTQPPSEEASRQAQKALDLSYLAADHLVQAYVEQVFQIRHQRQPQLETPLGCRLGRKPPPHADLLRAAFNTVSVPLSWSMIEAEETIYRWEETDALVDWARQQGFDLTAGPLIDFSSAQLPAWLWLWERDLPSLATFMCRYVDAAVRRYRHRIRRWQLTAASNWAHVLNLGEDELLGLTYRLTETARQVDPSLELTIGLAQPWGEYLTLADRTHSPFIFADQLIRSGLSLTALDLEIVMGVTQRGSYCRDRLELSRLLDLYALLGVPLQVTLGYPASDRPDADADPELTVAYGRWNGGFSPEAQAEWADRFASLVLCKPYVQGVTWAQFNDAELHQWPHVGLLDAAEQPSRPALEKLRQLRQAHLR